VDGNLKSYISVLRSRWKDYLYSDGVQVKLTTHEYTSGFLYPQFGGVVPKIEVHKLLQKFYNERIQFIPKEKRSKFNEYFKKAFEVEIGW